MASRIRVDLDLITAHASHVESVVDDIAAASSAAATADVAGGAFGVLCSFLVAPAGFAASRAREAIGAVEGMLQRSAVEIRGVAHDLDEYEGEVLRAIRSLGAEVDR